MSIYLELHGKYLQEATELAARKDLPQSAEKYWGATAEILKEIAEGRGWPHHSHRDLLVAVERLARETRDSELLYEFHSAEALHANFYNAFLTNETFQAEVDKVTALIGKLRSLNGSR